jgi:hypothetical protein
VRTIPYISDQFEVVPVGTGGGRRRGGDGGSVLLVDVRLIIKFSWTNVRSAQVAEFNGYLAAANLTTAQKKVSLPIDWLLSPPFSECSCEQAAEKIFSKVSCLSAANEEHDLTNDRKAFRSTR